LTNYELGYKMNSADGRFALDAAVFYIDWEDIQLFAQVDGGNGVQYGVNINGGTAVSKGVEFAMSFAATDALTFSFNGAYTDAYLTSPAGAGGLDGDPLNVPDWGFGLTGDYDWNLSNGATAYVGGTLAYTGERPIGRLATSPSVVTYLDDYTTLALRSGYDTGKWFGELYAKNVTDELGTQSVSTVGFFGDRQIGFLQPRTIGVNVGVRF
jgi:outer membrane receptor protein involved in Fe transport